MWTNRQNIYCSHLHVRNKNRGFYNASIRHFRHEKEFKMYLVNFPKDLWPIADQCVTSNDTKLSLPKLTQLNYLLASNMLIWRDFDSRDLTKTLLTIKK